MLLKQYFLLELVFIESVRSGQTSSEIVVDCLLAYVRWLVKGMVVAEMKLRSEGVK